MSGTARTISEIPLVASPQMLSISLNSVTYNLLVVWNTQAQAWTLDIADVNSNPLIQGIPLVTGCDLLEQYAYVGIGGSLYARTDGVTTTVPTFADLGTLGHLYFVTPQDPPPT